MSQWLCTKHHAAKFPDEGALSWCGGPVKALPSGSDAARETYIKFLEAGGSDYPLEILRAAGLDMTSRAPYDAVIDRMDAVMDQIEGILENREG